MKSTRCLWTAFAAVGVVARTTDIHMVQVQDVTRTLAPVVDLLKSGQVTETMLAALRMKFNSVAYGLSAFGDKPAPLTGRTYGYGLWIRGYLPLSVDETLDFAYSTVLPSSRESDFASAWQTVTVTDGKDSEDNQLDAIARAAVDPNHWWGAEGAAKVAVLVTDGFSHHSADVSITSDGYDVSFRGTQDYYNRNYGSFDEDIAVGRVAGDHDRASRGAAPSLSRVYRTLMVTCLSFFGQELDDAKRQWYADVSGGVFFTEHTTTVEEVMDYECPWIDEVIAGTVELAQLLGGEVPTGRPNEPGDMIDSLRLIRVEDIADYPYSDLVFGPEDDPAKYEYPDFRDRRYADMFKQNGVVPVFLVVPPNHLDDLELRELLKLGMANHCPIVRESCPAGDCSATWDLPVVRSKLADCLDEFYSGVLLAMAGVRGVVKVVSEPLTAFGLGTALADAVEAAVTAVAMAPTPSPTTTALSSESTSSSSSNSGITGLLIFMDSVLVVAALSAAGAVCFKWRRRSRRRKEWLMNKDTWSVSSSNWSESYESRSEWSQSSDNEGLAAPEL